MVIPPIGVVTSLSGDSRTYSQTKDSSHDPYEYATYRKQAQITDAMTLDWIQPLFEPTWPVSETESKKPVQRERIIPDSNSNYNSTDDSILLFDRFAEENAQRSIPLDPRYVHNESITETDGLPSRSIYYPGTPTKGYPQPIMTPAKDGHWYQKLSYSVLAFKFSYPENFNTLDLWMDIDRDEDAYTRYLTVYFDGSIAHQSIIGSQGFHDYVAIWWVSAGDHKVEVQINYCGWKDHGWKMTYIQPFISHWPYESEPILDFWECFPDNSYPELDFAVRAGKSTYLNLYVQDEEGDSQRQIQVYYRSSLSNSWTIRSTIWSNTASQIYIGYWSTPRTIYIKLRLVDSSPEWYGKKITYDAVSYKACMIEVDYMMDAAPNQNDPIMATSDITTMLSYLQWYYKLHCYARFDYYIDDVIPFQLWTGEDEFKSLHNSWYDHQGSSSYNPYEWVLIANKDEYSPQGSLGWHWIESGYDWGIVLFDYAFTYNAGSSTGTAFTNWAKASLLHEAGHHAGILDTNPDNSEKYCTNSGCVMYGGDDDNAVDSPWYCSFHWSLRNSIFG